MIFSAIDPLFLVRALRIRRRRGAGKGSGTVAVAACLLAFGMAGAFSARLHAQKASGSEAGNGLPDAPLQTGAAAQTGSSAHQGLEGSASISGTVVDASGALVGGARIAVRDQSGGEREVSTASDGTFVLGGLPSGTFRLTVIAAGMEPFVSPEIPIAAGENRQIPQIVLPIATANADVRVVVKLDEIAEEQVKAAEQQRVFGVLPNFYSSYIWNAAPLGPKQKFDLAFHSIGDPVNFLVTGILAGTEQAADTFPGYGQGAQGYAKRYGAAYADDAIARMLGSAILPSLLRQDPRYFYKGSGSTRSRIAYALAAAVVCRGDNGRWQPNYSYILGSFAAGGISNSYHPEGDRGAGLTISNGFLDIAGHAGDNLVREFLLRRVTSKVPDYERGKP